MNTLDLQFIYLFVCLFVLPCVCVFVCLFVCVCLFIYLFVCLFVYSSIFYILFNVTLNTSTPFCLRLTRLRTRDHDKEHQRLTDGNLKPHLYPRGALAPRLHFVFGLQSPRLPGPTASAPLPSLHTNTHLIYWIIQTI